MPKIISQPTAGIHPPSEIKVFRALRRLPPEWVILHSVRWRDSSGKRNIDGETDFLILHPERGALVIEVKGGGISIKKGRWQSEDRDGEKHAIDPIGQASAAKANLHKWLKAKLGIDVPTDYVIILPDTPEVPPMGATDSANNIITKKDLRADAILAALEKAYDPRGDFEPLSKGQMDQLIAGLAPDWKTVPTTLADEARDAEDRLIELTEQQQRILELIRRNPTQIVYGSAGTGKTVLACVRARQLRDEGKRVLLTCYSKFLARHLAQDTTLAGITISTFHALCRSSAIAAGISVPAELSDKEWVEGDAATTLFEAAHDPSFERFDAVIIDEGQDFGKEWILALESTCVPEKDSKF